MRRRMISISASTQGRLSIKEMEVMPDALLPTLLDLTPSRQLLHITYGKILNHLGLRGRLFALWRENRHEYDALLARHIGRHLALLCPEHALESSGKGANV